MRNVMFIVFLIAALIVAFLYISKSNKVPTEVREVLTTEQGEKIDRITQVPDAVRKKVDEAQKKAQKRMDDAMKGIEK
jgi:uncharacterized membrane protein